MRFGVCIKPDDIELIKELGFDNAELPLSQMAALSSEDFDKLAQRVKKLHLPVMAFNNCFPASIRLTGPAADLPAAWDYARTAFRRAAALGGRIVVFGSSGARNVPQGFPAESAWAQLVELLRGLEPIAASSGITVAIEHLNRLESNIVVSVADGLRLAQEVARPHIQVLADSYHMLRESEDPAILLKVAGRLRHVHVARSEARLYLTEADSQLRAFFAALRQIGYSGGVSVEGRTQDQRVEAALSLATLRALSGT